MELASVGETVNSTAAAVPNLGDGGAGGSRGTVVLDEQARKDRWMVMMVTVGMFLAFSNCFVGFIAGCVTWVLLEVQGRIKAWRGEGVSSGETTALLG